jgi:omega-amidase
MTKLTLSIAQMQVEQGNVAANLAKGEQFIKEAAQRGSNIILFPEMWTTGFNFQKNIEAAIHQEKTIASLAGFAKKYKIWITGSILTAHPKLIADSTSTTSSNYKPYNTSLLFNPDGKIVAQYSKMHLFSGIREDQYETAGNCITVTETPWGKTGLAICYDIRFPELFRSMTLQGAEIIFNSIAVPYPRLDHWSVLARARAIENQLFMVTANQVGSEIWEVQGDITFFGHSSIVDPWGKTVIEAGDEQEILLTAEIDTELAKQIREKMPVLKDRRPELYQL